MRHSTRRRPITMTYQDQLQHPNWQRKRLLIFERDKWKCTRCNGTESQLHAHHKQYHAGRKPWEYLDSDIVTLCEHCHRQTHAFDRFPGVVIPWIDYDENNPAFEIYYWTGRYARKDHPNLADQWDCENKRGDLMCFINGRAELFEKPSGIIGEAFFIWAQNCVRAAIDHATKW